jgi:hypothetical protein
MVGTRRIAVAVVGSAALALAPAGSAAATAHNFAVQHVHRHCGSHVIRFDVTATGLSKHKPYDLVLTTKTTPAVAYFGGFTAIHRAVHGRHVRVTSVRGSVPKHKFRARVALDFGSSREISHRIITVPHCTR